eukprot:TRINITY_DN27555_c0_g1_i1.p1 TRINITY_DN27555_c0_g1~~TRINITY_DN27555_c0_g1_i1.p1  ORF type:complete len:263 (-),score=51.99 TRINITY_DN27555_c0_g1_i1:294-1082(-)
MQFEYGFELTQDEPDQEAHMLCTETFITSSHKAIHVSLEYTMSPNLSPAAGGEGLVVYLVDASVPGWDTNLHGSGQLGFDGKTGAFVGIGIDMAGNFSGQCENTNRLPNSVAVLDATRQRVVAREVLGAGAGTEDWRTVEIRFVCTDQLIRCTVVVGGHGVIDSIPIPGAVMPASLCVGVCAKTSSKHTNAIAVNNLRLFAPSAASLVGAETPLHNAPECARSTMDLIDQLRLELGSLYRAYDQLTQETADQTEFTSSLSSK